MWHLVNVDRRDDYFICFLCMFCRSLLVLLYFFFWPLCCLFFDIKMILITSLWYLQTLLISFKSNCLNNKVFRQTKTSLDILIKLSELFNMFIAWSFWNLWYTIKIWTTQRFMKHQKQQLVSNSNIFWWMKITSRFCIFLQFLW
jgi:hypothetical protein